LSHGRGAQEPKRALVEAFGFGLLGFGIAMVLELIFVGDPSQVKHFASHGKQATELAAISFLVVGLIEELAKLLPLTWFVYKRPYFNTPTDGIIYYAFAGLGFGLLENILYTLTMGPAVGIARLILMPYFHAALTGIAGFYIVSHKLRRVSYLHVVAAIIVLVALHGLYDFLLESGNIGLILLALPILALIVTGLFRYMAKARKLDQELSLTVEATSGATLVPTSGTIPTDSPVIPS
jgi:RsiW-degrading membrane proteinase PrsW (M82 family)